MEFLDTLKDLYTSSGAFGQPILYTTLALMLVGSVMMFTVRLIKRFIFYTVVAFLLPNAIGVVGYLEQAGDVKEAVVERGHEMAQEAQEAVEDRDLSSLSFGLLGSGLAVAVGLVGIVRLKWRRKTEKE